MASRLCQSELDCDDWSIAPSSPTNDDSPCSSLESSISSLDSQPEFEANTVIQRLLELYQTLEKIPDFTPSPKVNSLFHDLVSLCLGLFNRETIAAVLEDARIQELVPRLRELCSTGESELEQYWSAQIAASLLGKQKPQSFDEAFVSFPYYTNYIRITEIESSLVRSALPTNYEPRHITFIGSGPLPLTSFLLLQRHFPGVTIANVDCNIQALAASKTLTSRLGISSRIECVHGDASSVPVSVLAISDVVYLAALVGLSSGDKSAILSSVVFKLKDGAVLVARSADGLRGLLYPVLDIDGLNLRQLGLELVTEWVPEDGEIVNSVVMFRKVSSQ